MTVADVSAWQYGLVLDELPPDITGVISKLTQNLSVDGMGANFLAQVRGSARWAERGFYHFLGPDDVQAQVDAFARALGDLHDDEFVALDWETNAFTRYAPPMADAYRWMTVAEARWPGRCLWYSYRSNAIAARQSGDFVWDLWLSDPNADGPKYAAQLDATLHQWGQPTIAPIGGSLHNLDCSDVLKPAALAALGDGMTPEAQCKAWDPGYGTDVAILRVVNGCIQIKLYDGVWYWYAQYLQYVHTDAHTAAVRPLAPAPGATALPAFTFSGTATPQASGTNG